jgi:hypothetical protein
MANIRTRRRRRGVFVRIFFKGDFLDPDEEERLLREYDRA